MTRLLIDPFRAEYMQRALVEAVLLGILGGIVGVHVVLRRLAFISDTLTHTVFPGIAIAFVVGGSLYLGALGAGLLTAGLFTALARNRRVSTDAALAVLLTSFFAVGVIVVSRTRTYTADLTVLLFGRVLFVDVAQIVQAAATLVVVAITLAMFHKELMLRAFDPEAAEALGYRLAALDLLVNVLITLVVVAAVQAVGTVLVIALLITPAATARLVARDVPTMFAVSAVVGAAAGWLGLAASYEASLHHGLRLASGATVVVVLTALFLLVLAGRSATAWRRTTSTISRRREFDRMSWIDQTFGSPEALAEVVLAGVICGVVGVHVVLRRLPFFAMALTHATFPGIVLAALLGVSLFGGALVFGVVVVVAIAALGAADRVESSTAVGVVLAGGFALGVLLLSAQDGFSRDLTAYLVGSVATVQASDVALTAITGVVVLGTVSLLHKELVLGAFDRPAAAALGYRVGLIDVVMLLCVELTVVTSLSAMGTILSIALIVAPAATARLWTERVGTTMILAAVLGAVAGAVGLALSARFAVAAGASIALTAAAIFAVSLVLSPHHGLAGRLVRGRPTGAASSSLRRAAG